MQGLERNLVDTVPFPPNGWKIEECRKSTHATWDASKVELWLSDAQENNRSIEGYLLRGQLAQKPVMNADALEYWLDHPHLIPKEWKGKYVFFWGTIYRANNIRAFGDGLCVRYLHWCGCRWKSHHYMLNYPWFKLSPAALYTA